MRYDKTKNKTKQSADDGMCQKHLKHKMSLQTDRCNLAGRQICIYYKIRANPRGNGPALTVGTLVVTVLVGCLVAAAPELEVAVEFLSAPAVGLESGADEDICIGASEPD